jgi:twinkle protein
LNWERWNVQVPQEIGTDGWGKSRCPKRDCAAENALRVHPGQGLFLCARCGYHGDARQDPSSYKQRNAPFQPAWWRGDGSEAALAPMANALGLRTETLSGQEVRLGETYVEGAGWNKAALIPCRLVNDGPVEDVLSIPLDPSRDLWELFFSTPGALSAPWGWDHIDPHRVIVVGHPLDRLALVEAGFDSVVCLPPNLGRSNAGPEAWGFLERIEQGMGDIAQFVLALRNDDTGHKVEEEFARRVGRERCKRTRWQGRPVTDAIAGAWTTLRAHGVESVQNEIDQAPAYPVVGVHELYDVEDRFEYLYEFGLERGVLTGWPSMDVHYTVKAGQMTIVTGIPGHGKSNLLDALLVNLARLHDWRFGLFSPENQPIERHYASLMEKHVGAPFDRGPTKRISPEQKNTAKAWLNDHFKVLLPDEENGNWSIDGVLALAKVLVYRYGIRGLVIDPWNELDHSRPSGVSETDHISGALTKIRRFARLNGVHVWIVAHPTKLEPRADGKYPVPTPYMISGGAHWRNKADNALSIYRNVGEVDDDICDVHVQKIRFKEIGRVGMVSLRCDVPCGRYVDDINQEIRKRAISQGNNIASEEVRIPRPRVYSDNGIQIAETEDEIGFEF